MDIPFSIAILHNFKCFNDALEKCVKENDVSIKNMEQILQNFNLSK